MTSTAHRAPATIHLETVLDAPVDRVWSAMQYPGTFLYVARGVLGVPTLSGRCEPFTVGERVFDHVIRVASGAPELCARVRAARRR